MGSVLAIDIGGTKIEVGIVDHTGVVLRRERAATRVEDPWPGLSALVEQLLSGDGVVDAVGVGCGGPMTPGGEEVSPLNIPGWRGFPLRSELETLTERSVFVDNDAKALALGEGWCGGARGEANYIAMVVSTGVGGGIVVDGRLLDGYAGNAGHIGHVIVEPDGAPCVCGARGCLEAEASGSAIERLTGLPAANADAATVERTGTLVGRGVASVVNLLDIRVALVGGSVALGMGDAFFAAAQRELDARSRISFARGVRIAPVGLGADGPLIGAAAVAYRSLT